MSGDDDRHDEWDPENRCDIKLVPTEPLLEISIHLRASERDDGGLRVWSDDLPGLMLSGADPSAVWRDLGAAIETLIKRNSKTYDRRIRASIDLKWGNIKCWSGFKDGTPAGDALQKYIASGQGLSAMRQTDEQRKLICDVIDVIDGDINAGWNGDIMTKEAAKKYVFEYGIYEDLVTELMIKRGVMGRIDPRAEALIKRNKSFRGPVNPIKPNQTKPDAPSKR